MSHKLVHDIISTQFIHNLKALKICLEKAQKHAESMGYSADKLMDVKLAPDMFAFTKQIQIASDNAKGVVSRLSGKEAPRFEDNEKTFQELLQRLEKTISYLSEFRSEDFKEFEKQRASFPWYPGKYLEAHEYLVAFALPNFYFHVTTAYNLLRASGVQIGKMDFLGHLNWKDN